MQYNSSGSFTGAVGLSYATSGTNLQLTSQHAADIALLIKGAAS